MNLDGEHQSVIFARDIFLFAVLTKGMAGRDLFYLTKDNIKDGILTYTSKVNGREKAVRMRDSLQEIVDRYAQAGTPYLFPIITSENPNEQWRQHDAAIHRINRNLRKLGRIMGLPFPLNLTVARHSWDGVMRSVSISDDFAD